MRPEYDQDEDALATLSEQCLERCTRECVRVANSVSEAFVCNLGPWLARNWLYVTEVTLIAQRVRWSIFVVHTSLTSGLSLS